MSDNSQNNKRIAKNSLFMGIRMVVVLAITLYSSRVVLNALGVVDYGIYNAVASFVAMFSFLNSSLSNGIQRFFNFELGKNGISGSNKVYNTALVIQILLAIIVVVPLEIFGVWYLDNKMVIPTDRLFAAGWVFQLSIITMILHILQVPYSAAIIAHEKFSFYAIMSVMNAVITLGATFTIPYVGNDSLIIYGVIIAAIAALNLLLYIVYAKKNFEEIKITRNYEKRLFKEMLSFSGWNIFGTFGHMLKFQGVSLVLNLFFGPIINAAHGIANQVNSGLQSFVNNLTTPVRPQVIQSYSRGNISRTLNLTYTISKASCYFLLIISLPIIIEINYVLEIWLGDNIPAHTSAIVVIIIIDSFLSNLNSCVSNVVHASGKMKYYQLSGGTISFITIVFVYFGMMFFNIPEFAFIIVVILDCVRQILATIILKRIVNEFSYSKYIKDVIFPIIKVYAASIILPLIMYYSLSEGFLRLAVVTIVSIISSLTAMYFIGLSNNEKTIANRFFLTIKNKLTHK